MSTGISKIALTAMLAGVALLAGCEACDWGTTQEVTMTEPAEVQAAQQEAQQWQPAITEAQEFESEIESEAEMQVEPIKVAEYPKQTWEQKERMGEIVSAMAIPTGNRKNSVLYLEKMAPREVIAGVEFEYRLRLTNLTDMTLENVRLSEQLPSNMQLSQAMPESSLQANTLHWNFAKMEAKQVQEFTIRGTAPQTGELTSCTDVDYRNPTVCLAWRAERPELQISKSGPDTIVICDPIVYKITVMNTGTATARDVKVSDQLPQGIKTMDGHSSVSYDIHALAPGESKEMTLRTYASETGRYEAFAQVEARHGFRAQAAPVSTLVTTPVLVVTKSGPEIRFLGRPLTYNIRIRNSGDGPAKNTVLEEVLGQGLEFISASEGGRLSGNKVSWNIGLLEPGQQRDVAVQVRAGRKGDITSMAVATAYCATGDAQMTTMVKGIPAILLETVDIADPIEIGGQETYVITVTNQGSAIDTNVIVKAILPSEMEFVRAEGPTKANVEGNQITFEPLASLQPRGKAVFKVMAKGLRVGDVRFRTELMSDQITTPVHETESTNIYE